MSCAEIAINSSLKLYHVGPSLQSGNQPSLFYFSLSGPDSLCTDPYNQLVQFLDRKNIRIFSLTLPAHEDGLSPLKALETWAQEMEAGKDPLEEFLQQAEESLDYILREKLADPNKLAVAGLSRGALLAGLLAARQEKLKIFLGFAPITRLRKAKEFHHMQKALLLNRYDLSAYAKELAKKQIRLTIGNHDTRVGTRECFECVEQIVAATPRTPQLELLISPSIGHQGHGTSAEVFREGADWICKKFEI